MVIILATWPFHTFASIDQRSTFFNTSVTVVQQAVQMSSVSHSHYTPLLLVSKQTIVTTTTMHACIHSLRRVWRSLDTESAATLVHAFVMSCIDYCNVLLAGAPKATTDKLQRLLNAAERLLSGTKKFDRGLSQLMHVDLHWLDVPEQVKYKLATMVYNCLHGKAPSYLTDSCTPSSDVASRPHLRSASRRQLLVPRHNLSTYGRRAFSVAGPTAWNCLIDEMCEPLLTANSFRQLLKTRLFAEY